jgi:subtilisin-like proprotein convertase family protein
VNPPIDLAEATNMLSSRTGIGTLPIVLVLLTVLATGALADSTAPAVELRSGVIGPDRVADSATHGPEVSKQRWVVRMKSAPGWSDRGALEAMGARVETPLPGWAYLVSVPSERASTLRSHARVDWTAPYLPQDKIAPEIAMLSGADDWTGNVAVVVHLFADANVKNLAAELETMGLDVAGARGGSRFGRIVLLMTPAEVAGFRDDLASRNDVFWIGQRARRTLANDNSVWISQSGLDGGMATPVFDQGIFGEGQIAAVLDTGLDADMCYFHDDALGLPPTNTSGGTTVDLNQRKVIAVDFLDLSENPADPTHWDTHGHGSHVTGTLAGDDLATPFQHDPGDGMAPGAKLVIQDGGYAPDDCGDLPGIGCPVTDLNPIFQQAYDQGARVHSNSWNDNENATVRNVYSDGSQDVDDFMWLNPDFLITFAIGNFPLGGDETMGSPATAKNCITTGSTFGGTTAWALSDISAWGPTNDGRIKPDVVFPGASIDSAGSDGNVTTENCEVARFTGTSMAAPGVSGSALLIREYFEKGWYPTGASVPADGFTPSAALLKAMLINSGVPVEIDSQGNSVYIGEPQQGWGRILLDNAMHFAGENRGLWVHDEPNGFTGPGDPTVTYMLEAHDASEPLEVTLVWTDYPSTPAASTHLVNDLDLRVDGPGGNWHGNSFFLNASIDGGSPDRLNNVENVYVPNATPGVYSIQISPHAIPSGPQPWALVVTGKFTFTAGPRPGHESHVINDSGPNGNGDGILDPGETATIPVTLYNSGDADAQSTVGTMHSAFPDLLKAYGNPVDYGDIAVDQVKSSAGPHYEVTLEPSATCGQILGLNMALSGNGFDVTTGFTTPVGVPDQSFPSTDTPLAIPANDSSGVWSNLTIPYDFQYDEVDVEVHIDHHEISQFRVILLGPNNTPFLNLHRYTGSGSGLHTIYDDLTDPEGPGSMDDFLDLGPAGTWRLRVIDDTAGGPAGTLESWTLHFKNRVPVHCNAVSCGEAVPPEVGNTLHVHKVGSNDVEIDWNGVGGASNYNVWRAADKQQLTNELVGTTGSTALIDGGAQTLPGAHFYVVRSVNSCRWESP